MRIDALKIEGYEPKKGDVLVFSFERPISAEIAQRIRQHVQDLLGSDKKVMILERGVSLRVVREADLDRWEDEGGR